MTLRKHNALSREYHAAEQLLDSGWTGTFGDLAVKLGRTSRSALLAVRIYRSYRRRHPNDNGTKVYPAQ